MSLYSYFRISKPSAAKVPEEKIPDTYKSLRNRTFWGATIAYSLYYVCRMSINVVKQPLIDEGILSAGELGLIGSALLFVYAVGKFMNGFIADLIDRLRKEDIYCLLVKGQGWLNAMKSLYGDVQVI